MSPSQKKINGDYRKFLRELLDGRLVLAVQSLNPHRVAEVMHYPLGQLGSVCRAWDKNHHWDNMVFPPSTHVAFCPDSPKFYSFSGSGSHPPDNCFGYLLISHQP